MTDVSYKADTPEQMSLHDSPELRVPHENGAGTRTTTTSPPKKPILVVGAVGSVEYSNDLFRQLNDCGDNFGNLLIGAGLRRILDQYVVVGMADLQSSQGLVNKCSHIVVGAANWLQQRNDYGHLADFLDRTKLPVTMLGLGAQSSTTATIPELPPNTLKMLRIVSDRSHSIGVRGNYTAEVLAHYGIRNVSAIGCPSLFLNEMPSIKLPQSIDLASFRVAVNFTRQNCGLSCNPEGMRHIENRLLAIAMSHEGRIFLQNDLAEMKLLHNIDEESDRLSITQYFSRLPTQDVLHFFRTRSCFFHKIADWSREIAKYGLSVGTRLHGNILALLNGVPAVVVAHDARTLEFCALLDIPHLDLRKQSFRKKRRFLGIGSNKWPKPLRLEDLLERAEYTRFQESYRSVYKELKLFLEKNGLRHSLH